MCINVKLVEELWEHFYRKFENAFQLREEFEETDDEDKLTVVSDNMRDEVQLRQWLNKQGAEYLEDLLLIIVGKAWYGVSEEMQKRQVRERIFERLKNPDEVLYR